MYDIQKSTSSKEDYFAEEMICNFDYEICKQYVPRVTIMLDSCIDIEKSIIMTDSKTSGGRKRKDLLYTKYGNEDVGLICDIFLIEQKEEQRNDE